MGRPRVKVIDDSQGEEKPSKKNKSAKSEATEKTSEGRLPPNAANSRVDEVDRARGDESQGAASEAGAVSEQESVAADRSQQSSKPTSQKKPQKPGKAKPRSRKYQEAAKNLDRTRTYPLTEAVDMVKKLSYSKINATLETHINTAQTGIRGLVSLPFASGKKLRILAFGKDAEESGADIVGSDEVIEEVNKGKINFDLVVAAPEWMPKLAKVARILGPRGLMPNPKNGTIVSNLKKAVEGFQAGKTEYKTEAKAPVIHMAMGKLNQPNEELIANIKTLLQTLGKSRVKKVTLSPTMGPSVKLDLSSV